MSRRSAAFFLILVPLGFGFAVLALGMDANWDLRNYHYYNAYAFLAGRAGYDILAAQSNTFFNPALDIPFYLATQVWPARVVGFLLGTVEGLNLIPLYGIAWTCLALKRPEERRLAAAGLALFGLLGAGNLSELGTTFSDNLVSLGPLTALWIVLGLLATRRAEMFRGALGGLAPWLWVAGFFAGAAAGLKQPSTIFALGLCLAFLALPAPVMRRFVLAFLFGVGVLVGFAASDGFWMIHLWHLYGNPLMPFYNRIFHSPWALDEDYRQYFDVSGGFWTRVFFPFAYLANYKLTSEASFLDLRLLLCLIALPAALVAGLWRKVGAAHARGGPAPRLADTAWAETGPEETTRYVFWMLAISYVAWIWMFSVYRYFVPGEMLAPLALVLAVRCLPLGPRWRLGLIAALFVLIASTTRPPDWIRVPWGEKWITAEVPALAEPDRTLVLITGHEPLSYLIPFFPPAVRFLRIHSGFTNPTETGVRFNIEMERIVAEHRGPIFVLFNPNETVFAEKYLPYYHLAIERPGCRDVPSNIGYLPYLLCPLGRAG